MRTLSKINDPVYEKPQKHNLLSRFFLRFIRDERDLPFAYLCIQMTFIVIPFAIILFTPIFSETSFWIASGIYWILWVYFLGPFTLMLHNTSHRKFFKRKYDWANYYIPWVIGPFMGQSPETYFSHHIGMHHPENNLEEDRSSTLQFQRDNFFDFLRYFGNFLFIGVVELVEYFKSKNRKKLLKKVIRGEFSYLLLSAALLFVNWQATLVVFLIPFVFIRFAMMSGNWAQHAFIDAKNPENNYRNSITLINTAYNNRCFNDGYHIGHHLHPGMHWTDMPVDFLENKNEYATEKALVFEGIDFQVIWLWLMLKRYDWLADHVVNINNEYGSKGDVIALLKERTQRIIS